jgi:hypothetical protein
VCIVVIVHLRLSVIERCLGRYRRLLNVGHLPGTCRPGRAPPAHDRSPRRLGQWALLLGRTDFRHLGKGEARLGMDHLLPEFLL